MHRLARQTLALPLILLHNPPGVNHICMKVNGLFALRGPEPTDPGLHRIAWDLLTDGPELIEGAQVDLGAPKAGVLVPPGTYTLRLKVDGNTRETKVLVKPDPRVKESGLEEQFALTVAVRDDISRLTRIVNRLRALRTSCIGEGRRLNQKRQP